MKSNATAREEEVRRFHNRYIASVKPPDGRLLQSGREGRLKRLAARVWLLNAKSVMR